MSILGRGKQQRKMKTATSMITRPMSIETPIDYAERSGAAFLPTLEGHVFVPFLQAIISGLYAGVAIGVISFLVANFAAAFIVWFDIWFQLKSALIFATAATFGMAWWSWSRNVGDYKSLLWYTEFAEGPEPEQPNKQVHEARVRVNNNWVHADLPFDREKPMALVEFAKGVSSGSCPFSERGAGRYGYSVAMYNALRDSFIKSRMAYWKNPKNKREGVGLNASGYALLRSVADNPPPPDYEPSEDWGMSPNIIQK